MIALAVALAVAHTPPETWRSPRVVVPPGADVMAAALAPPLAGLASGSARTTVDASASAGGSGLRGILRIWHAVLSPIDGPKCPMYPTCSGYCGIAIRRYGPLEGVVMTAARLMRETPDLLKTGYYPLVLKLGIYRYMDPPERSVFFE